MHRKTRENEQNKFLVRENTGTVLCLRPKFPILYVKDIALFAAKFPNF